MQLDIDFNTVIICENHWSNGWYHIQDKDGFTLVRGNTAGGWHNLKRARQQARRASRKLNYAFHPNVINNFCIEED